MTFEAASREKRLESSLQPAQSKMCEYQVRVSMESKDVCLCKLEWNEEGRGYLEIAASGLGRPDKRAIRQAA